jgi:hypothetical protein
VWDLVRGGPWVRRALALLLVGEVVAVVVLPVVLPKRTHLSLYLNDDRAAQVVVTFFRDQGYLEPDLIVGQRNRPNVR